MRRGSSLLIPVMISALCGGQQGELFEAARTGDVVKLEALAGSKAAVEWRGPHDWTALHVAAASCQPEAVRILVGHGWSRDALDDQKRTPAQLISNCPQDARSILYPLLMLPIREEAPWSLQYAAAHHQTNVVSMLVGMNVDVNAIGSSGNRPLDISCLKGDATTTRILLEHGANPNLPNHNRSTPLHDAALSGNREVVELLLKHGASINAVDSDSAFTALHYAASFGRLDTVKALVEHGADVTLKNAEGSTALQLAIRNNFTDVSTYLRTVGNQRPH